MTQQLKAAMADPANLLPNPWNTNHVGAENESKLEESIKRFGMFKPIVVRELPNGALEILGGQHRAAAAHRLGLKEVPVMNLGPISDKKAKEIGLVDNGRYGNDDTLQLAALLKELGDVEDLASFMPYSDQDFNNILEVGDLDLDDLAPLPDLEPVAAPTPLAKMPQTHALMRFKVPIEDFERVSEIINGVIKSQGLNSGDSLTNAGDALIHILNGLTDE